MGSEHCSFSESSVVFMLLIHTTHYWYYSSSTQISETDVLVFCSDSGNSTTCKLLEDIKAKISHLEYDLHSLRHEMQCKHDLLQRKVDSTVNEVQQIKDGLKSLNERVLSGSQIEEKLQSLAELIEQKVDQNQSYISEVHMSKSYFEQEYAGVISVNQTQISVIKNVVDQLQEKIKRVEKQLDDASNDRNPPNGIPTPFESLRSKLDQLVDSLVPKEVSVKRHTQVYEDRKERRTSIHKKPRPKSELTETPVMTRSSSLSSTTSSGYTSLRHQDSGELSLLSNLSPIGETDVKSTPGVTSMNPLTTPHRPTSTPGTEKDVEAPYDTHIIVEVAWAMGDLLDLLNTLSSSLTQQNKDLPIKTDNEK